MSAHSNDLIPAEQLAQATYALRVLAHPHRLRICEVLLRGRASVGEVAQAVGLKHNVVSQHLNKLRAHGLVAPRRKGRSVFYEVIHPSPAWLLDCIRRSLPEVDHVATRTVRPTGNRGQRRGKQPSAPSPTAKRTRCRIRRPSSG